MEVFPLKIYFLFAIITFNLVNSYDIHCSSEETINVVHSHVSFNYSTEEENKKKDCNIIFKTNPSEFLFFSFEKLSPAGCMPTCGGQYFEFGTNCDCQENKYDCKTKIKLCGGEQFLANPSVLTHQCSQIRVYDVPQDEVLLDKRSERLLSSIYHFPRMNNFIHTKHPMIMPLHQTVYDTRINDNYDDDSNYIHRLNKDGYSSYIHKLKEDQHKTNHNHAIKIKRTKKNEKQDSGMTVSERIKSWLRKLVGNPQEEEEKSSSKQLRVLSWNTDSISRHKRNLKNIDNTNKNSFSHFKGMDNINTYKTPRQIESNLGTKFGIDTKYNGSNHGKKKQESNKEKHHLFFDAKILRLTLNDVITLFNIKNDSRAREYKYSQFITFNIVDDEYIVSKRFTYGKSGLQYLFYVALSPLPISEKCDKNFTLTSLDEELKVTFLINYNQANSHSQQQLCGFNDKGYRIIESNNFEMVISTPSSNSNFIKEFESKNLIDSQLIIGFIPYKTNIKLKKSVNALTNWQIGLILGIVFFLIVLGSIAFIKYRKRRDARTVEQSEIQLQQNLEDI